MDMENNAKSEVVQRYVDILTNAGFKAVFGDVANKDAVMMIINEFLPENRKVEHIDYLPTNYQGPVLSLNKEHQYDFMCRDSSGALFIVEMQCYTENGLSPALARCLPRVWPSSYHSSVSRHSSRSRILCVSLR